MKTSERKHGNGINGSANLAFDWTSRKWNIAPQTDGTIKFGGDDLKKVEQFKYLEFFIGNDSDSFPDGHAHVSSAWMKWPQMIGVLCDASMPQVKDLYNNSVPSRPLQIRVLASNIKAWAGPTRDGNAKAPMVSWTNVIWHHERWHLMSTGSHTSCRKTAVRKT